MKQVVDVIEKVTCVTLNEANLDKFYGVDNDGQKELVYRYEDGKYGLINPKCLLCGVSRDENIECCEELEFALGTFINEGMDVYEFDTLKELLEWVVS